MTRAGEKLYDVDWVAAHRRQRRRAHFFDWLPLVLIAAVVAIVHVLGG